MARCRQAESGFSLVETLVVVFIVGLVASMVVMAVPAKPRGAAATAIDLKRSFLLSEDASITTGLAHGIVIEESGWTVHRFVEGRWTSTTQSARGWSGQFETNVKCVVETEVVRGRSDREKKDAESLSVRPAVWFDPLGQVVMSDVVCSDPQQVLTLRLEETGALLIEAEGS